ncbi:MAG: PrgI family protein [Patescibacteria group bacterium]|nr:PrgI family protein [Patescibacteria group bacterium]
MQFKIPQDVQQADKIVGPLTLKQLIITAIGGGISYFIYMSTSKLYVVQVWAIATAIPALLTIAIAFVKINDIPFLKFLLLQIERFIKPRYRHFEKSTGDPYKSCLITPEANKKPSVNKKQDIESKMQDLDKLTKILDQSK